MSSCPFVFRISFILLLAAGVAAAAGPAVSMVASGQGAPGASFGEAWPQAAMAPEVQPDAAAPPAAPAASRAATVGRLAMEKKPDHLPALHAALTDADPLVRRHAIYGLQRLADLESVPAIAEAATKDKDFAVRRTAVNALGRLPHKKSAEALVAALKDDNMLVRADAILALGRLADPATQPAIIEAMQDRRLWIELEVWPQATLIRVIGQPFFTDRTVIPVLKQIAESRDWPRASYAELDAETRHKRALLMANAAADVLAVKFADASGEDLLIEGLSGDDYMQQRSALALAAIKSKKAVPALLKMLESEWPSNKLCAIRALAASGDKSAAPALIKPIGGWPSPPSGP